MQMKTSKQTGVTTAEYLIPAVILLFWAIILTPVLVKARGKSRFISCEQNTRKLYVAYAMYADDHDGLLPPYTNNLLYARDEQQKDRNRRHYSPSGALLTAALKQYTHAEVVWFCPDDPLAGQSTLSLSYPAGLLIDHQYSSYETAWWMGLRKHPAGMDGITMGRRFGKPVIMDPAHEVMLSDEQIQQIGCGDWLYSHQNRFTQLYLDGHCHGNAVTCAH